MSEALSSKAVDARLAEIAHHMRMHINDFNHNLGMGHESLMICADRNICRLRRKWDQALLSQGITCGEELCKKTKPIAEWKFFFAKENQDYLIEASNIQCPCCGYTCSTREHPMVSRIIWVVNHAYLPPEEFFPHIEVDHVASGHSPCLG